MFFLEIIFWFLVGIIFYSYFGYAIIIWILSLGSNKRITQTTDEDLPEITLFVAAYNERDYVRIKMENSLALDYPSDKVKHLWVTDGSNDGTPDLLKEYPQVKVLHEDERNGKIAAMNRGMKYVKTPIVVFSDGNTKLGKNSLRKIAALFADKKVGCVAGEKRIVNKDTDSAAGSGEGIYWKYESWLKRKEAHVYSVVGAAGELFAIRTDLFQEVEADTLLDDFIISLRVAMQGYEIQYDPEAYAIEVASANVKEELKRKIRIAAGGMQSMKRLAPLLNIFRYGMLSFQYWSHKVLRWVAVPISLLLVFFVNMDLAAEFVLGGKGLLYFITFVFQLLFYLMVLTGWMLEEKEVKFKIIFVPYYLFIMNLCMYLGFFRYISGKQSVNWQRAQRGK